MTKPDNISQAIWDLMLEVQEQTYFINENESQYEFDSTIIALALSQAYSRGLEDAIMELKAREKAHGQYANSIAAIRALGSK